MCSQKTEAKHLYSAKTELMGFTLIETVLAISLMGMIMLAVAPLFRGFMQYEVNNQVYGTKFQRDLEIDSALEKNCKLALGGQLIVDPFSVPVSLNFSNAVFDGSYLYQKVLSANQNWGELTVSEVKLSGTGPNGIFTQIEGGMWEGRLSYSFRSNQASWISPTSLKSEIDLVISLMGLSVGECAVAGTTQAMLLRLAIPTDNKFSEFQKLYAMSVFLGHPDVSWDSNSYGFWWDPTRTGFSLARANLASLAAGGP